MTDVPAIWNTGSRKEAMDLLVTIWPSLTLADRDFLSQAIISGPPLETLVHIDEAERAISYDRRIYDRIIVLERIIDPPLTDSLRDKLTALRQTYPHWQAMPGERAHFGSWMEMRWGPDTKFTVDDLVSFEDEKLLAILKTENEQREGLLDAWRQLAIAHPQRAVSLLEQISTRHDFGCPDVWERGLWGLRDSPNNGPIVVKLVSLLVDLPDELLSHTDVSRGAADVLDSTSQDKTVDQDHFWQLFDRTLAAATNTSAQVDVHHNSPQDGIDWVSVAINSTMGRLATAFFDAMFAQGLKVGSGIPSTLLDRLNLLISPDRILHRSARVIASTRLSYLFAVDQAWTSRMLLPGFSWQDEEESVAHWQGYAWQARIDVQLWASLKPSFILLFRQDRLARMGEGRRTIAQLLMIVGIEFGLNELHRNDARSMIRSMTEDMRADAAAWIDSYLQQQKSNERVEESTFDSDTQWTKRVEPWLRRVWPPDPELRSASVSEQLACAAVATNEAFSSAVAAIRPYVSRSPSYHLLYRLQDSDHPDKHPRPTLELLDMVVERVVGQRPDGDLANIVRRIGIAHPPGLADHIYRRWHDWVEQNY